MDAETRKKIVDVMVNEKGAPRDKAEMCVDLACHGFTRAVEAFADVMKTSDSTMVILQASLLGMGMLQTEAELKIKTLRATGEAMGIMTEMREKL